MLNRVIKFFLENKLVTTLILLGFIIWGIAVAPFNWNINFMPRDRVPVDAIPNYGKNQQIVFTKWAGRSPKDIQDQITYPLTTALLGIPGVESIRSSSMFGFSSIYIIFKDDVEFYWSRTRILEKLNSLPQDLLPDGVQPQLGPDATPLGQIYWYTLEGRDKNGNPTGGWDLHELRTIQDWQVRYALTAVEGVSEVASIGGHVKEYHVNVDPSAMESYNVSLKQVIKAVKNSNLDVGASTMEINRAEYFVRGIGYITDLDDLKQTVVAERNYTPVRIKDIATVKFGPGERRGALDKGGAEVVGGSVVARYGANPMEVIQNVKDKIAEISPGLPSKTLEDGTESKIEIVPFYDRSNLIRETLGTLEEALSLQIILTIIVIIIMVLNLRASILISSLIPIAVLMCFIAMKYFGITANIVALSGIAIAIGTIVDIGIVLSENMIQHMKENKTGSVMTNVYNASVEVAPAIVTAVLTTIVSFLPVFGLQAAEGKLFNPLAYTKTFVLFATLIITIIILPALSHWLFSAQIKRVHIRRALNGLLFLIGIYIGAEYAIGLGILVSILGIVNMINTYNPQYQNSVNYINIAIIALSVIFFLTKEWLPLGPGRSVLMNYLFIFFIVVILLSFFALVIYYYKPILRWALHHTKLLIALPLILIFFGLLVWMGFNTVFGFVANGLNSVNVEVRKTDIWSSLENTFPGIGKEFMPALDEGSFLLMPTSMPHAGFQENKRVLQKMDMAVEAIPEVKNVVGKLGRVQSALDPAPISMYENVINYKTEYKTDEDGRRLRFAVNDTGEFLRDSNGHLIPDNDGEYYRQWRDHIHSPDDIWNEIVKATDFPGVTSAPKLQPIETRLVMLQTGMRAPMGIKVFGPDLQTIEDFSLELEKQLQNVEGVKPQTVYANRVIGKPYIEIQLDKKAIGRYGLSIKKVQNYIEVAVGGIQLTKTVEGRERFGVRVRYPRELRNNPSELGNILIPANNGRSIPLEELSSIEYVRGPQVIKSENTFLVNYITFGTEAGYSEGQVVNNAQNFLKDKIDKGAINVPSGISYNFAGNYQNQIRASKRLSILVPIVLVVIFLIIYFQFQKVPTTLLVFSGILIAFAGGFIVMWLYGIPSFMDFSLFGANMRELFNIRTVYLSVAVWVGFIALFGIATDNGVIMATYLEQNYNSRKPQTYKELDDLVIDAGNKRIRPCLMTTATTLLALLPILSSTGRGADVMQPMAIPIFGGMTVQLLTLFVLPVVYRVWRRKEIK